MFSLRNCATSPWNFSEKLAVSPWNFKILRKAVSPWNKKYGDFSSPALYFSMGNPYMKFQNPSMHGSQDMACIDFIQISFQRCITPERDITRTRKKCVSTIFPWGTHMWNFKTLACMFLDERTDGQPETNMPQFFLTSVRSASTQLDNKIGGNTIRFPPPGDLACMDNDIRQNQWTMKYRSLTYIYCTRLIFESHWSIIPSTTFLHQTVFRLIQSDVGFDCISSWSSLCLSFYFSRHEAKSLDHKIQVTDLHILDKVNLCVTLIHYTKYDVHPSNNLEGIKQNHYTMKYMSLSCWLIFTMWSKFGSHCIIIWKYDTHASNNLGDIRQNHWTMKYRTHRPTFILRSNIRSYWPIIPK